MSPLINRREAIAALASTATLPLLQGCGEKPAAPRRKRQRSKHSLGPAEDSPIRQDELDGAAEILHRDFGKAGAGLLRGRVVHAIPRQRHPSEDPAAAETAVAVEEEKRPGRRSRDPARPVHAPKSTAGARSRRVTTILIRRRRRAPDAPDAFTVK